MCSRSGTKGLGSEVRRVGIQGMQGPEEQVWLRYEGVGGQKCGGYLPPRPGSSAGWPGAPLCSRAASCAASARCRAPRRPGSTPRPQPRNPGSARKAAAARGQGATPLRGPCRRCRSPALRRCPAAAATAAAPALRRALALPPPSHFACARSLSGPFGTFPRPASRSHSLPQGGPGSARALLEFQPGPVFPAATAHREYACARTTTTWHGELPARTLATCTVSCRRGGLLDGTQGL